MEARILSWFPLKSNAHWFRLQVARVIKCPIPRQKPDQPFHRMRKKLADAVARWKYIGNERPDFAIVPAEGEESVWLYPRPPACLPAKARITVRDPKDGSLIASSDNGYKMHGLLC